MEGAKTLGFDELFLILCGIVMGTVARIITLKVDTRQHPSYPTGSFINIVIGFIAACLGAVAIPALLAKDFVAVTFLSLAIQHFREVRKLERESLGKLEHTEFTGRGEAYIDGIAKTFEARNYISLITALLTVMVVKLFYTKYLFINITLAVLTGLITVYVIQRLTKGKNIGDICSVAEGKIRISQSELYVDEMFVTNILGTDRNREMFDAEGLAFVITPNKEKFRLTLDNYGQRQAILFEAVRSFGVKRFKFVRKNYKQGKIIIAFIPLIRNPEGIMDVIRRTPVLETSRKIHSIMTTHLVERK